MNESYGSPREDDYEPTLKDLEGWRRMDEFADRIGAAKIEKRARIDREIENLQRERQFYS